MKDVAPRHLVAMPPDTMQAIIELDIGPGPRPGTYAVRVARSLGGGTPSVDVELDVDEILMRRPGLESSILSSAVRTRRVLSDEEGAVRSVGLILFESVFTGAVGESYRTSRAVADERGHDLQVRVRTEVAELAALPWEALFDPDLGTYICRHDPLVRVVPASHSREPLAVTPPLRILAMVAAPSNLGPIDVASERERLEDALGEQLATGSVEIHWLEDVSWRGLHGALLSGGWHILHFVGHGGYDESRDEGMLAFIGRDGRAEYVDASSLSDLLKEADPTPRLVVLNSCQSAAGGSSDLFSSVGAALVRNGIDAVAAMQFAISDAAAVEFSNGFYTALAHGRGIDAAVRSGRIGILGLSRGTLEWVTPVLYLRGDESLLFELTGPESGAEPWSSAVDRRPRGSSDSEQDEADRPGDSVPGSGGPTSPPLPAEMAPAIAMTPTEPRAPDHLAPPARDDDAPPPSPASSDPDAAPPPDEGPIPHEPERSRDVDAPSAPSSRTTPATDASMSRQSAMSGPTAIVGRVLWILGFAGAAVAAVAGALYALRDPSMDPPTEFGYIWLVGWGAGILAGTIAVSLTAARRRLTGVLLALAPIFGLIALGTDADDAWAVIICLLQIALLTLALLLTRPRRAPRQTSDERPE